ncbi:MAG: hypothetical protein M0Z28_02780 [Rhodospirillales bacterium]|nr:hypothetical protein [Rhodospirillales bacterium]
MDNDRRPVVGWLPALVLLALVALGLAGWRLFPLFAAYMERQDCIASGHVNCGD